MPVRDDRRIGPQKRHGLALHVRTHQRAVGVVVLEERDQRRRDRNRLPRADVDVLNFLARHGRQVALHAGQHHALLQVPVLLDDVRRSEDRLHLFVGAEVLVLAVDLAVLHHAVRRDEEAVFVDVGIDRQRRDQTDVGAFRRFDRTDSAIVRNVHVAHFEARALAVQTAGPKGRQTPLVRELRQRVGLVDDLRQLAAAEEEIDRAADALGVDQLGDAAQLVRVLQAHALLDGALELQEALAKLFAGQFVDRAQTAVAQMIDVVDVTFAAAQLEHVLQRVDQVLAAERHHRFGHVLVELAVDAEAADAAEAIAVFVEELFLEQRLGLVELRRVAGTQPGVDLHQRVFVAGRRCLRPAC